MFYQSHFVSLAFHLLDQKLFMNKCFYCI